MRGHAESDNTVQSMKSDNKNAQPSGESITVDGTRIVGSEENDQLDDEKHVESLDPSSKESSRKTIKRHKGDSPSAMQLEKTRTGKSNSKPELNPATSSLARKETPDGEKQKDDHDENIQSAGDSAKVSSSLARKETPDGQKQKNDHDEKIQSAGDSAKGTMVSNTRFEAMCDDIIGKVIEKLDGVSVHRCSLMNKRLKQIADDDIDDDRWKRRYRQEFQVERFEVATQSGWRQHFRNTKLILKRVNEFASILREGSIVRMSEFWLREEHISWTHHSPMPYVGYDNVIACWDTMFENDMFGTYH